MAKNNQPVNGVFLKQEKINPNNIALRRNKPQKVFDIKTIKQNNQLIHDPDPNNNYISNFQDEKYQNYNKFQLDQDPYGLIDSTGNREYTVTETE